MKSQKPPTLCLSGVLMARLLLLRVELSSELRLSGQLPLSFPTDPPLLPTGPVFQDVEVQLGVDT